MTGNKPYPSGKLSGGLKPRYVVINSILGEDFTPNDGLDVFIDLNTFVSTLSTSRKFLNSLPFAENVEEDLISSVLMIVKHWKDYMRKYDNTRIILFINDFDMGGLVEEKTIKSYLVPYMNKFSSNQYKQLVYYWNEAIKRIEIVLKYIPNVYIIRCNRFDSYVVPNIMEDYDNNNRHRVIVSGNSLMTNYCYMKNTRVIYSKYKHTGMCQMSDPLMICQTLTKINEDIMSAFIKNKVFYNLLNAIIGDFDRGIMGLTQIGMSVFAVNLLRAVEKRDIPEDPQSIESVLPAIDKSYHDYLRTVYPLVDIVSHSMMIPQSSIEKMRSSMVDMYDIDSLSKLNVNGLNLLELI